MLQEGLILRSNLVILFRSKEMVDDLEFVKYQIPLFQYVEFKNIRTTFKILIDCNKIIARITENKMYDLYIPHQDCFIFYKLSNCKKCIKVNYIEEGNASLCNLYNNNRDRTKKYLLFKMLGIQNRYRFFDVINSKFNNHVGFFKPIDIFNEKFIQIKTQFRFNNFQTEGVVVFLDKIIMGYKTSTEEELIRVVNLLEEDTIFLKLHPNYKNAQIIEFINIIRRVEKVLQKQLKLIDTNLTFDEIMARYNFKSFYTGYSSSVIELLQIPNKQVSLILSSVELSKYYGDQWKQYPQDLMVFAKRNSISADLLKVIIY